LLPLSSTPLGINTHEVLQQSISAAIEKSVFPQKQLETLQKEVKKSVLVAGPVAGSVAPSRNRSDTDENTEEAARNALWNSVDPSLADALAVVETAQTTALAAVGRPL
jgi:hypothetical protein